MRVVRIIVWIVAVAACVLVFVRTGSVACAGIAAGVLVVPILGWVGVMLAARRVSAQLACATTASKQGPVQVSLALANASLIPVAYAQAAVKARNLLTTETCVVPAAACLAPHGTANIPVELSSEYCGRVECSIERVTLFDPFRLFSRTIACKADRRLTIMPTLQDVYLRDAYAASPLSDTTVFSPYVKGSDLSEVFGLREYEAGDELKRIHWKLSEKTGQMVVREASLPLDNALLLFWDKRVAEGADRIAQRADAMAEVVLALMEQLARAGISFEVASNDIPASRCARSFVTDESAIYEAIGQLLSAPVAEAPDSGLAEYVRFYGPLACSRLLYVCAQRPYDLETLMGNREAVVLACDGDPNMEAKPPVIEIHFPPDGARAALQMLEVL